MDTAHPIQTRADQSLLEGLDAEARHDILRAATIRSFSAGTVLFCQNDPANTLYLINTGRVRATQLTPDGDEVLLRFLEPGQMLGGMAALNHTCYPLTATAEIDVESWCWRRGAVGRLIDRHPRLARNMMRQMAQRISELQQRMVEMMTERVEQRIARTVLRLAGQLGRKVADGVLLDLSLSRQDLAAMTGTTLYTVSRVLSRWSDAGWIESGRQRLVLRHAHALVAIAEGLCGDGTPSRS